MPIPEPRLQLAERHQRLLLQLLQRHVPQAQVWAYGSRVTGGCQECSDLDLVLRNPQQLQQPCAGLTALRQALQDSLLPMMVDVHDWAGLPEGFHAGIERAHIELQAGTSQDGAC